MEYIELLLVTLLAYSGISQNRVVSASLQVREGHNINGIAACEGCDHLNRYCDVESNTRCGACKSGYQQRKIRERYSDECIKNVNADDSVIDRLASAGHHTNQVQANQGEVLSPVVRQDADKSQSQILNVQVRANGPAGTVTTKSTTSTSPPTSSTSNNGNAAPQVQSNGNSQYVEDTPLTGILLIAVVAGCSIAGVVGLIVAGVCWYRLQKNVKAAKEAEYPGYGVTGPDTEEPGPGSPGDRKLAHSAQMYHYQHQKQQMLAMEKANGDMTKDDEDDYEEENEEGDYTVYECPGLAPTGEMEVKNPLFSEDNTPVTPSSVDARIGQK